MAKNSVYGSAPYITLDSTDVSSKQIYKTNKPGHFKTILPSELKLEGTNWEVGLVWTRIPFTWRTISKPIQFGIIVKLYNYKLMEHTHFANRRPWLQSKDLFHKSVNSMNLEDYPSNMTGYIPYYFPAGFYPTRYAVGKQLADDINSMLKGTNITVHFFERPDNTYGFNVLGGQISIWTSEAWFLKDLFGLKYDHPQEATGGEPKENDSKLFGIYNLEQAESDLKRTKTFEVYSGIEMYCNAVAPYAMGSSLVQHLTTISTSNVTPGESIVYHANPIIYYPVSNNYFNLLEVKLANRTGDLVEFFGGDSDQVTVQLHFRQHRMFGI